MSHEDNAGPHGEGPKHYRYFVDRQPYETKEATVSGAQIKAMIPNFNPTYQLLREGQGNEPDQVISDSETISLGPPPPRFYTVPPAVFGR